MSGKAFLDTNIVVYAFIASDHRAEIAAGLLEAGGTISVQVLNEFASVARRKLGMSWDEVDAALEAVKTLCGTVLPMTVELHAAGLDIARRYGFGIYDALIVAAAIRGRCQTLYSEDMQDGQRIEGLTVRNPFGA